MNRIAALTAALMLLACPVVLLAQRGAPRDPRPDHELSVGAQHEQRCEPRTLVAVGRALHIANFREQGEGAAEQYDQGAIVVAAACKSQPSDPRLVIVAAAYSDGTDGAKPLVVALLDQPHGQLLASYRGEIDEDAAMKVEPGSLWIDTAAYELKPGLRAFGLDVTSGIGGPSCAEGGFGATRALYVQEGAQIRPVLENVIMSNWHDADDTSNCGPPAPPRQTTRVSIGVAATSTMGWRDLWLTATRSRDDGKPPARAPARLKLIYDGKRYSSPGSFGVLD